MSRFLAEVGSCHRWWQADLLPSILRHRVPLLALPAAQTPEHALQQEFEAITRYAEAQGLDAAVLKSIHRIAQFFPLSDRIAGLSFEHHALAFSYCEKDRTAALDWLCKARNHDWSLPKFRAELRGALVPASEVGNCGPSTVDPAFTRVELQVSKWLPRVRVMTRQEAIEELGRVRTIVEYVETLQQIAAGPS